jgi:hypothetical protein
VVTIQPKETNELLANPHMGWQTFHCFADTDKNLAGLPSGAAYFRFYWREIEPAEGQIDFPKIDALLAHAQKAGQRLSLRVMCAGSGDAPTDVPQWLKDKGCKGFTYRTDGSKTDFWVPDFDDPLFQTAHGRLLRELGRRYDAHPGLDSMDIGSVGLWGEWHMSGTGVDVPPLPTRLALIDAYRAAFPTAPKVMLIGDVDGLRHAARHGCGWRADCLGDMGGFSKNWNHMDHMYRQNVAAAGAGEAWKRAPVSFESCWEMSKWKKEGWDIRAIFDYALDLHASHLNNKSAALPEGTRSEVERLLRRLGYRLVLRRLEHPQTAKRGGDPLAVGLEWENVGVAPPYGRQRVALRLTKVGRKESFIAPGSPIRGWLPGMRRIVERVGLPKRLALGRYDLAVGVVEPATSAPAVRLAITGRAADGWYPLSQIDVT